MKLLKKEYALKRKHNGCLVWIENSITPDNISGSLVKPHDANSYPHDEIFNLHLTTIKR